MSIGTRERRRSVRTSAAYPATLYDHRGRALARGRVSNISENGLLVIAEGLTDVSVSDEVAIDFVTPVDDENGSNWGAMRRVYRIVRIQRLNQLVGLGLESIDRQAG